MGAVSKAENARRMKMCKQGLSDVKIACELGLSTTAICDWRKRRGLPSPYKLAKEDAERKLKRKICKLNKRGWADAQIASELGLSRGIIRYRRKDMKLPSHRSRSRNITETDRQRLKELHAQGMIDSEIAMKLECSILTVYRWRDALGLPPNYVQGHRPVLMHHQVAKAIIEISEILPEIKCVLADVKREPESYKFKYRAYEYWGTLADRLAFLVIKFPALAQEMGYELDGMPELIRAKGERKGDDSVGG